MKKAQNKTIEFCWVPSHVGIKGNEKANVAASGQEGNVNVYHKDLFPAINTAIYIYIYIYT